MLARRRIRRILIVPPAGLVGNWERELRTLFGLEFSIVSGAEARSRNPFCGAASDRLIISVDTLAGDRVFARLQDPAVEPYDLAIFDEAHKLSANQLPDFSVVKTDRYRLAEAIAGVEVDEPRWLLRWSTQHLLLAHGNPAHGKGDAVLLFVASPGARGTGDSGSVRALSRLKAPNAAFSAPNEGRDVGYSGPADLSETRLVTLSFSLTQGEPSERNSFTMRRPAISTTTTTALRK